MTTILTRQPLSRDAILPEGRLEGRVALERGRALARDIRVGPSAFLAAQGVASELEFKRRAMAEGRITFHAQIGYRSLEQSRRAYRELHDRLAKSGGAPDRYGICLDWSMGYPARERAGRPRGTGLILERAEDYARLTAEAPVAPHFGDFVLGMPAAVENASGAILAGATTIGNLAQYFTFRLPGYTDDVTTTLATVEALGLLAGQGVEMLVHSNLDDGYAAWFEDIASALGFAMIEKRVVEDLIGLPLAHCFGHTYTVPLKRLAFHIALSRVNPTPGSMLYGNTTLYGAESAANFGALASYVLVDLLALARHPSGHAVTPIPVTEAQRIPTIEEVVEAHLAARRLAERLPELRPLLSTEAAEAMAEGLVRRGSRFAERLWDGLIAAGFDETDPAEMLLALRRIGPARLEEWFGEPPAPEAPAIASPFVDEIEGLAGKALAAISPAEHARLQRKKPRVVIATTDVHFYGKRLLETVLHRLEATVIDGGVSVDPDILAETAAASGASAIALSTYNGVALDFAQRLRGECARRGIAPRLFIGGRLNQILEDTGSELPVEVSDELRQLGFAPCADVESFLRILAAEGDEG